jgi:hypothetical protein
MGSREARRQQFAVQVARHAMNALSTPGCTINSIAIVPSPALLPTTSMPSLLMNALGSEGGWENKIGQPKLNNPRLNVINIIRRDLRIRGDRHSLHGPLDDLTKLDA